MAHTGSFKAGTVAFILAASAVAIVLNLSWFGVYTFVNAFLITSLDQSTAEWAQATLWFLGGMLVGQLTCTEIAAHIGRRRTVTLALAIGAGAYLALSNCSNVASVHVVMSFMGLVPAILLVVWLAIVAEYGGSKPGKAIAYVMIINSILGAAMLAVGSKLVDILDHRVAFRVFAALSILSCVAFYLASLKLKTGTTRPVVSIFRLTKVQFRGMLGASFITVIIAGFCIEAFLSLTINQLFPNLAREAASLSDYSIGNIVALGRLPALVSLFIVSLIIDRVRPHLCYGIGMMLAGLLVILTGESSGGVMLIVSYLLFYSVYGIIWGSNMASLNASVDPSLRDAAFAIASAMAVVAIVMVGGMHRILLATHFPLCNIVVVCGCIGVFGGLVLILYSWFGMKERFVHGQRV